MYSTRSDKGIVSTTEKDASSAAIDILNSGGNAIDAALAASGVLSVNSQHQCGIGKTNTFIVGDEDTKVIGQRLV